MAGVMVRWVYPKWQGTGQFPPNPPRRGFRPGTPRFMVRAMRYLHTMVRVRDVDASLRFYCDALGLREVRRHESEQGRFTLIFLAAPGDENAQIELTYNWDSEDYGSARNFGHVAYEVDDIYVACQRLADHGVAILRPPRDGRMAFVRSPDLISIELLQKGEALPPREPWASMPSSGAW